MAHTHNPGSVFSKHHNSSSICTRYCHACCLRVNQCITAAATARRLCHNVCLFVLMLCMHVYVCAISLNRSRPTAAACTHLTVLSACSIVCFGIHLDYLSCSHLPDSLYHLLVICLEGVCAWLNLTLGRMILLLVPLCASVSSPTDW